MLSPAGLRVMIVGGYGPMHQRWCDRIADLGFQICRRWDADESGNTSGRFDATLSDVDLILYKVDFSGHAQRKTLRALQDRQRHGGKATPIVQVQQSWTRTMEALRGAGVVLAPVSESKEDEMSAEVVEAGRAWEPWTKDVDAELSRLFRSGLEYAEIAAQMGRTAGAVKMRIYKIYPNDHPIYRDAEMAKARKVFERHGVPVLIGVTAEQMAQPTTSDDELRELVRSVEADSDALRARVAVLESNLASANANISEQLATTRREAFLAGRRHGIRYGTDPGVTELLAVLGVEEE